MNPTQILLKPNPPTVTYPFREEYRQQHGFSVAHHENQKLPEALGIPCFWDTYLASGEMSDHVLGRVA